MWEIVFAKGIGRLDPISSEELHEVDLEFTPEVKVTARRL